MTTDVTAPGDGMTLDDVRAFIAKSRWIFAKTMPESPHFYTLRRDAKDVTTFFQAVEYIRHCGRPHTYYGHPYIHLDVDGWRYWTMGAPLPATILINRCTLESLAGLRGYVDTESCPAGGGQSRTA